MIKFKKAITIFAIAMVVICMNQTIVFAGKGKININAATQKELATLKYVGDKIAHRIIEYRKAHPFKAPEDIMNVKGVGQKAFDANKHLIIIKDE